jgi:hypothetical protein
VISGLGCQSRNGEFASVITVGSVTVVAARMPCIGFCRVCAAGRGELGGYRVQEGCFLISGQLVSDPERQLGNVSDADVRRRV